MADLYVAAVLSAMVLAASMLSVELGISVAIIEILFGVVAGNVFGIQPTPWVNFIAGFASIVLTFLAGAEVDPDLLRARLKESLLIGGLSFLAPFALAWAFTRLVLGWEPRAAQMAGVALSDTSVAVVYALLVETGLTERALGKLLMAATSVSGFGTAAALSLLFITPSPWILAFIAVSVGAIVIMPRLEPWFFPRYGNRVIEPEIKGAFAVLFMLMFFGELAQTHAILPAFLLGLAVARIFQRHRLERQRFRVVAFAFLTPFFFLKGGMNVSVGAVLANLGIVALLFGVKVAAKILAVYPVARRHVPEGAWYLTLLMSTGLTFGTISSVYGLNAGIIDRSQFSVLVTVVLLTAVVPTLVAQRWFAPATETQEKEKAGEMVSEPVTSDGVD